MLAITGVAAAMIVKQWKSDFLPLLRLALALLFAFAAVNTAAPLLNYLNTLMGQSGTQTYAVILVKALGVAVLTQCCGDICRECGENGIASGVELIGKLEILLLSIPLIHEILGLAQKLFLLGN